MSTLVENLPARLRLALELLAGDPSGSSNVNDLWARICEQVPLTEYERSTTKSGAVRGSTSFHWYSTDMVKAGWLAKSGTGIWSITDAGRHALTQYPDAVSLREAAAVAYKEWRRGQSSRPAADEGDEVAVEDLSVGLVPPKADPLVRSVARTVLATGLTGGSHFAPGRPVWSAQIADDLFARYNEQPDLGAGGFIPKLAEQLAGAPADTVLLTAELLTVYSLPLVNQGAATKRDRIRTLLGWTEEPVALPADVEQAFTQGSWNGGAGLNVGAWKALAQLVVFLRHWWAQSDQTRQAALDDPWVWEELVHSCEQVMSSQREALLYLGFPDRFLPMVNTDHKAQIRDAFAGAIPALSGRLDRDLFDITVALQVEQRSAIDYYQSPWLQQWSPPQPDAGTRRAWLVRPKPGGADLAGRWLRDGFVSLSAGHLPHLQPGASLPQVRAAVEEGYQHLDYPQRRALTGEYHAFGSQMQPHDVVATVVEDNLEVGLVTSSAVFDPAGGDARLRRTVAWGDPESLPVDDMDPPLASLLDQQGTVVDLTSGLDTLLDLMGPAGPDPSGPPEPTTPASLPPVPEQAATDLHLSRVWLQELVDVLNDRHQVVLYGPPGTGKTFIAQRLARRLTGRDAVRLVQFHPSYAYEDFFEGFRPAASDEGGVGFTLTPGPLREIASEATANPTVPYVLIVDEINRANLAKVFGELYFLLEYRQESIRLQYSPSTPFTLPSNLYLIGTMNTADRSIALVDAALRRRFAFIELHPATPPVRGLLTRWLNDKGSRGDERPALLDALNEQIGDTDRDFQIGPAYLMTPDADRDDGLDRIWRYSILPLLEEQYYGRYTREEIHSRFGLDALRRLAGTGTADPLNGDGSRASGEPNPPDQPADPASGQSDPDTPAGG